MNDADGLVDLLLRVDPRWIELPLHTPGDLDAWATAEVASAAALRGRVEEPSVLVLCEQVYLAVVEQLRARTPVPAAAFALVSDQDLLPVTVVELTSHPLDGAGFDAFVDALVVDASERFDGPLVDEVVTALGVAARVEQLRVVSETTGDGQEVQTSVVYAWPVSSGRSALTLSAWFDSPVDAELNRAVLEDLAVSLHPRLR